MSPSSAASSAGVRTFDRYTNPCGRAVRSSKRSTDRYQRNSRARGGQARASPRAGSRLAATCAVAEARQTIDISTRSILRVLGAIVVVWLWLHLWQLLMLVIVAVVLAIGLEPLVEWLGRHRVPRS